ncbi:hypothetical protein G8D99_06290 [Acinetobacter lanii]|uniref:Uncharacterized protein n=1 Tax=Acinetobacter lanii TaxID=2715163 RepID=A0A6G8S8C0_9GAMM|nr:hypothetical protein G8D99_06290 [Acinetobacter lanii]
MGEAAGDSSYNAQLAGVVGKNELENNEMGYSQLILSK